MRLLLDTHIALWLATERGRLTPGELGTIIEPDNEVAISAVSIWELRIKWNRFYTTGTRKGPVDPLHFPKIIESFGLPIEALSAEECAASLVVPIPHGDPFDELLLTVAQQSGRKLLTRDSKMRGHPQAFHAD